MYIISEKSAGAQQGSEMKPERERNDSDEGDERRLGRISDSWMER